MLRELKLTNYRGFRRYAVSDLARVNLFVGKNNCGKTAVLEAMHLLATHGDMRVLKRIAVRRGEFETKSGSGQLYPIVSHLFHSHDFTLGAMKLEGDGGYGELRLEVKPLENVRELDQTMLMEIRGIASSINGSDDADWDHLALGIESKRSTEDRFVAYLTSPRGCIYPETYRMSRLAPPWRRDDADTVQFLGTDALESRLVASMWNQVILESRETEVFQVLRLLDPELRDVVLLNNAGDARSGLGGILVSHGAHPGKRVPLGSFGEGLRRLFFLSLCLNQTRGGILLIDEIDTGLHYSIMGDLWLLVVKAAVELDIQVFATTHSADCVRGLASLCENHPDLGSEVTLQRIDPELGESVVNTAEDIKDAVEFAIEVR